ncbi:hypothetical protein FBUS_09840 [Fasciolopsis buskii]|uniref:Deltamethrin resistance protein prag01 domain-containing protein n=1 Tax=Fasciolopsis buskii TaxID=27845 RepID=A0A8E0S2M2_9TREM|nr:hypothetical protein FBUS_09839 [Fasciolopsis buski]KAA0195215.1 hypothetical protein FBUS_09840 [Fasciolopsis buski]
MRFPSGTYDELQVPQGKWEDYYNKQNATYNKFLFASIIAFVVSLGCAVNVMELSKYTLPPNNNTAEGLKFLSPDPEALEYIKEN